MLKKHIPKKSSIAIWIVTVTIYIIILNLQIDLN